MIAWIISPFLVGVLFAVFVPRGLYRRLLPAEMRLLRIFLVMRLVTPQVMEFVGDRVDSFFTGGWDAWAYHLRAIEVMEDIRSTGRSMSHLAVPGTGAVDLALGRLYLLFGAPNWTVAAYVATAISTVGIVMFWAATRDLVNFRPDRYALVVLFAPTTLFWSSSIGKEAPILFGIGAMTLGLRLLLSGGSMGKALFYGVAGAVTTVYVRPHVTLAFFVAVALASFVSRSRGTLGGRPSSRIAVIVAALVGVTVGLSQSGALLGVTGGESVIEAAYDRAEQTAEGQGRSSFTQDPVRSPLQIPGAVTTVVLRPFPWESRTFMQALASLESLIVLGLLGSAVSRHLSRQRRYDFNVLVLSAIFYTIILSSAVASYGNFGLIVRQRMQIWPFVIFVIFAPRSRRQPVPVEDAAVGRTVTA